jgi:FlaA1/EpsC-like NDP-sugar epimerase
MVVVDILALILALWSAFALRYSDWWPHQQLASSWFLFGIVPLIGVITFAKFGLYRAVVRYMNVRLLQSVALGVMILVGSLYALASFIEGWLFPRSIPLIFGLSGWLYLGGSRMIIRSYFHWLNSTKSRQNRVLVVGANEQGANLVSGLQGSSEYNVIGFCDEDSRVVSSTLGGLWVYSLDVVEDVIAEQNINLILLSKPQYTDLQLRAILERLAKLPVRVKMMPTMHEFIEGSFPDQLRQIEIDDLLAREVVCPNEELLASAIKGKSVCITGAGGSIGSELARQALDYGAATLVLFDISEFSLYSIEQELSARVLEKNIDIRIIPLLGSVQDESRLFSVFNLFSVNTVLHAAAYKHVPLVEQNILQGLANNTLGTYGAAIAAQRAGVDRFVLISTDKAVRPTNVMGATKRFSELCIQSIAESTKGDTVFSMVRFGNVLGSSGSVVPLFRDQIEKGGPVTVTHPDINRYFMTISEAASLVIQAGAMAKGGEVFVLDMGEPVKILSLAETMIHLSGKTVKSASNPNGDIEVLFSGLRPGEKLYEELLIGDRVISTPHEKIMCAQELALDEKYLHQLLEEANEAIQLNDSELGRETLKKAVEEFSPTSENIDWVKYPVPDVNSNLH